MSIDHIRELAYISQKVGGNPAYVQGGGGNTSYKNDSTLFVKASGCYLKDLREDFGIVPMDLHKVRAYVKNPDKDENIFGKKMQGFVINTSGRPSIEAGFHAAVTEKFIIHSHSVYLNILACAKEGKEIAKRIFGEDLLWIDYFNPGSEILQAFVNTVEGIKAPKFIILQNHGFITSGSISDQALENHEEANIKVIKELNLSNFKVEKITDEFKPKGALFPDQIVYISGVQNMASSAYIETVSAYNYIINTITCCNLTPMFIPENKVNEILSMDSEKYRKSVSK